MRDFKEILQTIPRINKASFGTHVPVSQETTFASVYILPGADTYQIRKIGTGISSYDNSFFIRCIVNEDCTENELQWCDTRNAIIEAILADSGLWTVVVDRDITSVIYDDMNTSPKMTMELLFEFNLREDCE